LAESPTDSELRPARRTERRLLFTLAGDILGRRSGGVRLDERNTKEFLDPLQCSHAWWRGGEFIAENRLSLRAVVQQFVPFSSFVLE
jgi:hypothetical protein